MTTQIAIVLGTIVIMTVMFLTEVLPLPFTALLVPVLLQAGGVLNASQAWSGFSHANVITWIGLFIIGSVFAKTSVTYQMKRFVSTYGKGSGVRILTVVLLTSCAMALLTSATAAIAILAPIITEICKESNMNEKKVFKAVADTVTEAGILTFPIGSSLSYIMLCDSYIELQGGTERFGLFDFTILRLPMLFILIGYYLFVNRKISATKANPVLSSVSSVAAADDNERHTIYSPVQEKMAVFIFVANVVGMVFVTATGLCPSYLISTAFAALAVGLKLISEKEAISSISWSTIFLVAGTLPLSNAISVSGAGTWMAEMLESAFPSATNPTILALVFVLVTTFATQFMSNAAVMSTFCPIAASMALVFGLDPRLIVAAATVGANISFVTPMATTACTYAYGYCGFKMKEYIKMGLMPNMILVVFIVIWAPIALNFLYA